ncbi:protein CROWDED NUCLEI 4-like [Senna tora]|uniref:Protein CROWDED NUCLEI 4-like n=1 Tax=Senna tora TaxID=362788 RepID=A0A834SV15_9FABA|nr:protein CROWDED NUCLEI 4-like [Senna tora]
MPIEDICGTCGENNEDLNHVFLNCNFARAVWFGTHLNYHSHHPHDLSMLIWFEELMRFSDNTEVDLVVSQNHHARLITSTYKRSLLGILLTDRYLFVGLCYDQKELKKEEVKESPQQETANFCLMAKETEEEGEIEVTEYNPHFDELLESYNNLLEDSRKVVEKYSELKVSHSKVLKAFGKMKIEKEALEEKFRLIEDEYSMTALITENKKLKATIDKLNYDLGKFVRGEENLNLILGNANDRSGLGFEVESSGTKRNKEVDIEIEYVAFENQLADIFIEPLVTEKSFELRKEISFIDPRGYNRVIGHMWKLGK